MEILCFIKTTQYEHYKRGKYWSKLSKARKSCLKKGHENHSKFLNELKRQLSQLEFKVTYTKKADVISDKYDLIMTCGGDGTFLNAAHLLKKKPILGLNSNHHKNPKIGSIGALTSINKTNLEKNLKKLKEGKFNIEKWKKLDVKINGKKVKFTAINDIFIGSDKPYKSSDLEVIYKNQMERFSSSGILICSPVGSKAWFRNAGGKPFKQDKFAFIVREPNLDRIPKFVEGSLNHTHELIVVVNSKDHLISFDSQEENCIKLKPMDKVRISVNKKDFLKVVKFCVN